MAQNTEKLPDGEQRSLAHSINTAILSSHIKINRLILDRMPHAVPPQTDNPSTYISGLLHIGAIYIAFESLWQNLLGIHTEIAPIPYAYPFSNNSNPDHEHGTPPAEITERTRHILEAAYWPNLLRADRVKADIRTMTGWPAHVIDEQLRAVGTTGALGTFLAYIEETIDSRPHLLLAYAYSLYLALLSGGSYIRAELMYLRAGFWLTVPEPIRPGMVPCTREYSEPESSGRQSTFEHDSKLAAEDESITLPLSFFDFDPPLGRENPRQQAKDLKAEFKRRFAHAEQVLSDSEKLDIIAESVAVFEHLEAVVEQLDEVCGGGADAALPGRRRRHAGKEVSPSSQPHPQAAGIASRLRDSIAIAKGRLLRMVRNPSGAGAGITATTPLMLGKGQSTTTTGTTSPESSVSSKVPSNSSGGLSAGSRGNDSGAHLARDAVVPGEGFRTIRYDDDSHLNAEVNMAQRGTGGYDGPSDDDQGSVSRDSQVCPMTRSPALLAKKSPGAPTVTVKITNQRTDCALNHTISIISVLIGVAVCFAAFLWVRRCDGCAIAVPADFMRKDW
ncbi:hypothetical protein Daus18300_010740 [Diaporthe australafricana]|uniref:Heme oxygenase n=1 Tax=Diaporthe australafricana TaxID=127596 RepID=A0ABR3W8Y2_9PEZI